MKLDQDLRTTKDYSTNSHESNIYMYILPTYNNVVILVLDHFL